MTLIRFFLGLSARQPHEEGGYAAIIRVQRERYPPERTAHVQRERYPPKRTAHVSIR